MLNATENIDIVNDDLIAFDMEDAAKKEYFPLVAIITLQMVIDKIKKREGVNKELIIDEALDFLSDDKFGDFIAYLYRTFRKKRRGYNDSCPKCTVPEELSTGDQGFNTYKL